MYHRVGTFESDCALRIIVGTGLAEYKLRWKMMGMNSMRGGNWFGGLHTLLSVKFLVEVEFLYTDLSGRTLNPDLVCVKYSGSPGMIKM